MLDHREQNRQFVPFREEVVVGRLCIPMRLPAPTKSPQVERTSSVEALRGNDKSRIKRRCAQFTDRVSSLPGELDLRQSDAPPFSRAI